MQIDDIVKMRIKEYLDDELPTALKKEMGDINDDLIDTKEMNFEILTNEINNLRTLIDRNIGRIHQAEKYHKIDRSVIDTVSSEVRSIINSLPERVHQKFEGIEKANAILATRVNDVSNRMNKIEERFLSLDFERMIEIETRKQMKGVFSKFLEGMFNYVEEK